MPPPPPDTVEAAVYRRMLPSKRRWRAKLGLRITALIMSIVILGMAGSLASFGDDSGIILIGAPAAISIIWNAVEIGLILKRDGHRSAHPAVAVSIDLILWLAFATILPFVVLGSWILINYDNDRWDEYGYDGYGRGDRDDDYLWDEYNFFTRRVVEITFIGLNAIFHFTLFVFACIETSLRNRMKRAFKDRAFFNEIEAIARAAQANPEMAEATQTPPATLAAIPEGTPEITTPAETEPSVQPGSKTTN